MSTETKIRIKVRNQGTFLDHIIPDYIEESPFFNFVEYTNELITNNGLSLNNTIIYEYNEDGTIECLGIDDGYEMEYNERIKRLNKK